MKRYILTGTFLSLIAVTVLSTKTLYELHLRTSDLTIPSISQLAPAFVKGASLEFSNIISNYIMLSVLTFMGEKVIHEKNTTPAEWEKIYNALKVTITLDPRSSDPFILATTTLPWEAGMVHETNELLKLAAEHRPNDYRPYFFLWYNYYYFLTDLEQAAIYLQKAAGIPGAPKYLKPLTTRMYLYSGQLEGSLLYTKETLDNTIDPSMRQYLLKRLDALKKIHLLEETVKVYQEKYQTRPKSLGELVTAGLLDSIPDDPYGGQFFITNSGRVYTNSKLVPLKK